MRKQLLQNVLNAMQPADELGGLEGQEYILLMQSIASEANRRIRAFCSHSGLSVPIEEPVTGTNQT